MQNSNSFPAFLRGFFVLFSLFLFTNGYSQPLSGQYTIDHSGSGDFTTISAAGQALMQNGVNGPVTFNIASGIYTEQVDIDSIPGTGPNRRVTFRSATGDTADVYIEYKGATGEDTTYVIQLVHTDYVTFRDLTIRALDYSSLANAINCRSGVTNVIIDHCHLYSYSEDAVHISLINTLQEIYNPMKNFKITNNQINVGGRAALGLSTIVPIDSFVFENNMVNGYEGIYLWGFKNAYINHNIFNGDGGDAINFSTIKGNFEITHNKFTNYGIGIQFVSLSFDQVNRLGLVANNFIEAEDFGINGGLFYKEELPIDFYYNTVHVSGQNSNAVVGFCEGCSFKNNIFAHSGGGHAFHYDTAINYTADYNDYYTSGNNIGSTGLWDTIQTLAQYKQLSGQDANSINVDPQFRSRTDLHIASPGMEGKGTPIPSINKDIDGELRDPQNPDIGADEMTAIANLVPKSLTLSSHSIYSGSAIQLNYSAKNEGNLPAYSPWSDAVYLSKDKQVDKGDMLLGSVQNRNNVLQTHSYNRQTTVTIPEDSSGTFWIIVVLDYNGETFEDESDNEFVASQALNVTLSPRPELKVTGVTLPSSTFSGKSFTLEWTVENTGQEATQKGWSDYIYAARDSIALADPNLFNPDSLFVMKVKAPMGLKPGDTYTSSANITLPVRYSGTRYYKVVTDYGDAINEMNDSQDDNGKVGPKMTIQQSPLPDLEVENFFIQNSGFSGGYAKFSFTVKNYGNAPTLQDWWRDRLIFSTDSVLIFDSENFQQKKIIKHGGNLKPDSTYTVQDSVYLGSCTYDTFAVYFEVDYWNQTFELSENNNLSSSDTIEVIITPQPDLKVTQISNQTANPASGQNFQVKYRAINDGFKEAYYYRGWMDRIFLSSYDQYHEDSVIAIGGNYVDSTIEKGETYGQDLTLRIPDSVFGNYYLYAYADHNGNVCEAPNEDNNIRRSNALNISLTPPPDLRVSNIKGIGSQMAGGLVNVEYTVENDGPGETPENEWQDRIFLLKQGQTMKKAYRIGQFTRNGELLSGQSYTYQRSLYIPLKVEEGNYQIVVKTDRRNDVYEHNSENNNLTYSTLFFIERDYSKVSDLSVENLSFTGNPKSGQTLQVTFNIKNLSKTTSETSWYDKLYLLSWKGKKIEAKALYHFGQLDSLEDYNKTVSFTLPNGTEGDYWLQIQTDTTGKVLEYSLGNNIKRIPVTIQLTQPPDLEVDFISKPDTARSGQQMLMGWITDNNGPGQALDTPWVDKIYLSRDTLLDNNDIYLTRKKIRSVVSSGDDYQQSMNPRLPLYISGNFYVIVQTDADEEVYEHTKEDNNYFYSASTVHVFRPEPADLWPDSTKITYDPNLQRITYTVENVSSNPVKGSWKDAIYISKDDEWSEDDLKVREHELNNMDLQNGDTYTETVSFGIPFVKPDNYYFIIKVDGFNYIPETDLLNNEQATNVSYYIDRIKDLEMDSVYSEYFERFSRADYFEVNRPSNTGMIVKVTPQSDDVSSELYHRKGDIPDRNSYDTKYDNPHQADQKLLIPSEDQSVNDFLFTYGAYLPGNIDAPYEIIAKSAQYSLFSINPAKGGQFGIVTCHIRGFDFTDSMEFELRKGQDTIEAFFVNVLNTTEAIAHFDLRVYNPGLYDIVARQWPSGNETIMQDGFEVEMHGQPEKYIEVVQPPLVRPGQDFTIQVHYGNRGNINMYDNVLVVAFANDSMNVDDFQLSYMGSSEDRYYPDLSNHPNPPNDSNIINMDGIKLYVLWLPLLPAKSQSELTFKLNTDFEGMLYAYSFLFQQPLSKYSFGGRFPDLETAITIREIGTTFTNNPDLLGQNKSYDCDDLNYDNIKDDVARNVIDVAESVHPNRILGAPGRNLVQKAKNAAVDEAKGRLKDKGKQGVKDWARGKGVGEVIGDWIEETRNGTLLDEDPPFSDLINQVGDCIDTDQLESDVDDCFTRDCNVALYGYDPEKTDKCVYTISPNCCPECHDGGGSGGGGTESREPKDPNKIVGPKGMTEMRFVKKDDRMVYTIFFENMPSARVPAQEVLITNPLQEEFRLQDFELMEVGFGDTFIQLPSSNSLDRKYQLGQKYDNNKLQVVAGIDVIGSRAFWRLTTIDPRTGTQPADPSSGFLPPNDSTGVGEGYVKYQIRLDQNVTEGTQIDNQATIVFDNEMEIKTNTWTNVVAGSNPSSFVKELPRYHDSSRFVVEWDGIDGQPFGVGLSSYDIFYAKDSGRYERWLIHTKRQSAEFVGEIGHTYRFYSIAFSNDDNAEAVPTQHDAIITLSDSAVSSAEEELAPKLEGKHELYLFPNPAKEKVWLTIVLKNTEEIDLSVYNMLGKKVTTIHNGNLKNGSHQFDLSLNQSNFKGGVYFVVLKAGNSQITRRLVQVK